MYIMYVSYMYLFSTPTKSCFLLITQFLIYTCGSSSLKLKIRIWYMSLYVYKILCIIYCCTWHSPFEQVFWHFQTPWHHVVCRVFPFRNDDCNNETNNKAARTTVYITTPVITLEEAVFSNTTQPNNYSNKPNPHPNPVRSVKGVAPT